MRRWYAMSVLSGRYTDIETAFDQDLRQIDQHGLEAYAETVIATELSDSFWTSMLPQLLDTSSSRSPYFIAYKAAQAKLNDKAFLSRDITVRDLILNRGDVHHVYPRGHLKQGLARGRINRSPTTLWPKRSTSPSATSPHISTSLSSSSSVGAGPRSTAASPTWTVAGQPTRELRRRACSMGKSLTTRLPAHGVVS